MAVRYKITAAIIKPGGMPVRWTRYSRNKMTLLECEKLFSSPGNYRGQQGEKIRVTEFLCEPLTSSSDGE
ncbi:TPA: DUF1187 family protein [Escherichia coli]|nr:DUF1187 family protein [Escherichia coli]